MDNNTDDNSPFTEHSSTTNSLDNGDQETLWVGDLPLNATVADIKLCFEQFAPCIDVQIKKTSDKEKFPLNYAMNSRAAAQDVYRSLTANPSMAAVIVDGEPHSIRLGWARTNTTLHISHLDSSITEEMLYSLFSQYGELIAAPSFSADCANTNGAVIIHNSKADPDSEGKSYTCSYATITFMCRENAEEARIALNGTTLGSKTIRVEWNRKKQTNKLAYNSESKDANNNVISIYVQFENTDTTIVKVNESFLMQVFQSFGGVTDCYIKSNNYSECRRRQAGYGFIHFENNSYGQQCARTAAQVVGVSGRFVYNGVTLKSEVSRNFMKSITGENQGENGEITELNFDSNNNTYQEYDHYFQQSQHQLQNFPKKQFQPQMMFETNYNMMNMMMSENGIPSCFYNTFVDMMGNQYLVPIPVQLSMPSAVTPTPRIWPTNMKNEISSPCVYQSTIQLQAPSIPQVDYKNIANINPSMMMSPIPQVDYKNIANLNQNMMISSMSQLDYKNIDPTFGYDNEQCN